MAIMLRYLYEALRAANVPDATAQLAAEESASYENRITALETKVVIVLAVQLLTLSLVLGLYFRH